MNIKPERAEYIINIFKLREQNIWPTNKILSEKLEISPSSVTEMLRKLKAEGLIEIGKKIELTKVGVDIAKNLISRHRLWEYFLSEKLGFRWEEVHTQAQLLQNVTSDLLFDKLNKSLDYPKYCPHGGPIFANNDIRNDYISLLEVKADNKYRVRLIYDDKELLKYVDGIGLKINDEILIKEIDSFDGSCIVIKKDNIFRISNKACKDIFVERIN